MVTYDRLDLLEAGKRAELEADLKGRFGITKIVKIQVGNIDSTKGRVKLKVQINDRGGLATALNGLGNAALGLGDLLEAQQCFKKALEIAIEHSDQQIAKNCLFLLSEIAVRRGDTFGARRYLHELTAYYPEAGISEEIIDVFLATDLTTVVNLRG